MKKILICISAILFIIPAGLLKAQGPLMLTLTPDARTAAMGNAGTALSANEFSIYQNISSIAFSEDMASVGYSFMLWQPGIEKGNMLHSLAGYYRLNSKHSLALGARYFSGALQSGEYFTDENGNPLGLADFRPNDIYIDLGYAYTINDYLAVGANVRYISSSVTNFPGYKTGSAFAADLGVYFKKEALSAGLTLSNLGTKINYGSTDVDLPAKINASAAYALEIDYKNVLTGALQIGYMFLPSDDAGIDGGIGIEYMYDRMIAVRAGYFLGNSNIEQNYITAGLGVNINRFTLNYTYLYNIGSEHSITSNTMLFTLGAKF